MKLLQILNRAAIAVALAFSAPAYGDTPLAPPADFTLGYEGASIVGDVSADTTTIQPSDGPPWVIPEWARTIALSRDQRSALVFSPSMNLLAGNDPDQIVATVWYVDGAAIRSQPFTLGETMDPADMPRSVSHFVWLETWRVTDLGWELDLSDGKTITITAR